MILWKHMRMAVLGNIIKTFLHKTILHPHSHMGVECDITQNIFIISSSTPASYDKNMMVGVRDDIMQNIFKITTYHKVCIGDGFIKNMNSSSTNTHILKKIWISQEEFNVKLLRIKFTLDGITNQPFHESILPCLLWKNGYQNQWLTFFLSSLFIFLICKLCIFLWKWYVLGGTRSIN